MADSNIAGLPAGAAITNTDLIAGSDAGSGTLVKKTGLQFNTYIQNNLSNLPTTDPHILGMLWNNGGLVAISQPFTRALAGNTGTYALTGHTATLTEVVTLTPEVIQFFDRLVTMPSTARQTAYEALINGLVNAGVWAKLDCLYIYAAADTATAFVNLTSSALSGSYIHISTDPVFTVDSGFSIIGINSLETGFIPSAAVNFSQNDACGFAWQIGNVRDDSPFYSGIDRLEIVSFYPTMTSNRSQFSMNANNIGNVFSPIVDGSGFWVAQRTASNACALYHNNTLVGTSSDVSIAPPSAEIVVIANNTASAIGFGKSLSGGEQTSLYNLLTSYLTAVGAI